MDQQNQTLIHSIDAPKSTSKKNKLNILVICAAIIAGIATGYLIKQTTRSSPQQKAESVSTEGKTVVQTAGIQDDKTFPDQAEGLLKEGGIEGEGAFHLQRPGGESQNVYLTSTTVDLEPFLDKTVRVSGKTFQGKKAGWLMDVGYVELLE